MQDLQLKLGEARTDAEATRKQLDGKAAEAQRLAGELEAAHLQVCASTISIIFREAPSLISLRWLLQIRLGCKLTSTTASCTRLLYRILLVNSTSCQSLLT